MERREEIPASGVAKTLVEAGENFQFPLRATAPVPALSVDNPSHGGGVISSSRPGAGVGVAAQLQTQPPQPVPAGPSLFGLEIGTGSLSVAMPLMRKRGRPRKYPPDGSVLPLSPKPISASMPPAISMKRGRRRPSGLPYQNIGEMVTYSASANFTPHVITVAAGEEITTKIISFSQQEPMVICILLANGSVSDVTLRQPHSSGGILTYEGLFELLSLSGSFMPNDRGGTKSRSRGMSVSVASPDGRVLGGGVAGLLVAASPVQVVVGSFLPSHQLEQKTIKSKLDSSVATPTVVIPMSTMDIEEANSSGKGQYHSSTPQSSSFGGENWSSTLHG